jgi:hypothetical protein
MAKDEASAPNNFEAPAPVCVCGLLVVPHSRRAAILTGALVG